MEKRKHTCGKFDEPCPPPTLATNALDAGMKPLPAHKDHPLQVANIGENQQGNDRNKNATISPVENKTGSERTLCVNSHVAFRLPTSHTLTLDMFFRQVLTSISSAKARNNGGGRGMSNP